jgi:hypothetical protein
MRKLIVLPLSVLSLTILFANPANAGKRTDLENCRVANARIQMLYGRCLGVANLRAVKGQSADLEKCDEQRSSQVAKASFKFNYLRDVSLEVCGLDPISVNRDQALQLLAGGFTLTETQTAALAGSPADVTADNAEFCADSGGTYYADSDTCQVENQGACEAMGGTWGAQGCMPASYITDRDCFRVGACGIDGFNAGSFVGMSKTSSGCGTAPGGNSSYELGAHWRASLTNAFCPVQLSGPGIPITIDPCRVWLCLVD